MSYVKNTLGSVMFIGIAVVLLFVSVVDAQQMKIIKAGEGGGFLVPELMAFISLDNKQLTIAERLQVDRLPKEYQTIDIQKGDIILMVDGKKVATPDEMQKMYDKLTVGQEMKLGIKRGDQMMIASFKKMDPSTMPKFKQVIKTEGDDKGGPGEINARREIKFDGDPIPMLEMGVLFVAKDGKITVGDLLHSSGSTPLATAPQAGDLLVSLQGQSYSSAEALQTAWDKIAVGDTVRIVLSHEGKETKSDFAKPEAMGHIEFKKSK